MRIQTRSVQHCLGALIFIFAGASTAEARVSFFHHVKLPLPYEATRLLRVGPPVSLQPHEVLIEGYALSRSGRAIQSVAVYPGAMNQLAEAIPSALAVTDDNGFFSIVVDRERFTHLAAGCLVPSKRGELADPAVALSLIVLPRADVSQAERTFRLDLPRDIRRCSYPIEGPPGFVLFSQ